MSPDHCLLHGLVLSSEISLDEPTVAGRPPDVWAKMGPPLDGSDEFPEREVVAELVVGGRRAYAVAETGHKLWLRFPGLADFLINPVSHTVSCHLSGSSDPRFLSILLPGTALSVYMSMLGRCVLHASAVEVGGRAVVFAGLSGMGKSTCAALACASGARLITDDVLVVESSDEPEALPGASHIRLREQASSILSLFAIRPRSWEMVDGRVAVAPLPYTESAPIAGLVIPRPSRDIDRLEVRRLRASQAMPRLLAFARIPGWKKKDVVRRQFLQMGALADQVPIFEASIPWGPPFDIEPVRELVEGVRLNRFD